MRVPRAPRPATAPRSNHDAPESPRAGARRPAPGDTAQPADADNAADASPDPISPAVFLEPADGSTFVAGAQVELLGQLVGPGPTANVPVWCINATKGVAAGQAPLATDDGGVFALSWVVKPGSQTPRCSAGAIDDPVLYAEVSPQGNVEPSTPVLSVDPLQAAWAQPPLDPDTPDSALQTQSATAAIIDVDVCDTALSPCAAEGTCTETPGLDALIGVARVGTEIAELEDAERAARRAIEEATELGARHHVLAARIQLGAALLLRGDRPEAAAETFEAAVEEADRLGESSQRIYALSQLSMVHAHNARLAEAEELARKTLADLDQRLDRRGWAGVGRLHSMLGLVCQRSGRFGEAGSQYGAARRAIKRSGDQGAVCMIEISVGTRSIDRVAKKKPLPSSRGQPRRRAASTIASGKLSRATTSVTCCCSWAVRATRWPRSTPRRARSASSASTTTRRTRCD